MITVDSLLYETTNKLNKLSSNIHQQIELEDMLIALNEAQNILIKQKYDPDNAAQIGFEGNSKRYEDLEILVEDPKDHPLTLKLKDKHLNEWVASLSELSPKYMFYIDSYLIADKGNCKDRVVYVNKDLVRHSDIATLLTNNNYKPSFEYQETFCDISSRHIGIYTDGTFTPKKIFISYLRYPKKIDKEGYTHLDGSPSVNQDCELNDYLKDELTDLAVRNLAMYTDNPLAAQSAQQRIITNE